VGRLVDVREVGRSCRRRRVSLGVEWRWRCCLCVVAESGKVRSERKKEGGKGAPRLAVGMQRGEARSS
jgi:hypothetical protein